MFRFLRRLRAISRTRLISDDARCIYGKKIDFHLSDASSIEVRNGKLELAIPLNSRAPYASYDRSVIALGEGAKIFCNGNVTIAPGANIRVMKGAELVFDGDNRIGHNCTILVERKIIIGRGAAISWGVTLIDDDGHTFHNSDLKPLRRFYKPLIIGKGVGIQMNVTIPSGVEIGDNSIIAACAVLRRNVPANSLIYDRGTYEVKNGFRTNFSTP